MTRDEAYVAFGPNWQEDVEDYFLYCLIGGDYMAIYDIDSGGPQCEDCGSWKPCGPDDDGAVDDGTGTFARQTGYDIISRGYIQCEGCGAKYAIKRERACTVCNEKPVFEGVGQYCEDHMTSERNRR